MAKVSLSKIKRAKPEYSERYQKAAQTVLENEGGFVNHSDDPGGATKWGISLRWLQEVEDRVLVGTDVVDVDINKDGDLNKKDIKSIGIEEALEIYYLEWWKDNRYYNLGKPIGEKVFDMAVNMGSRQAHRLLQMALNTLGERLTQDGLIGPKTKSALDNYCPQLVVDATCDEQFMFYHRLVDKNQDYKVFLDGWINRAVCYRSRSFLKI